MLNREQVNEHWGILGPAIYRSLERLDVKMENVLRAVYVGSLQCWIHMVEEKITSVLLTTIIQDDIIDIKKLLVYSLTNIRPVTSRDTWKEGIEDLVRFGKANGCGLLTAYTTNNSIVEMLRKYGAGVEYHVSISIGGEDEVL